MAMNLAPYACTAQDSRGRFYTEDGCFMRDPLQRDRDRIIHATAFRRLKHKAQVFIANESEYYRTRLTHSMEVAQVARGIARSLELNEDLAEAVSLAHDLGHPPFGHAGEDALSEALKDIGGFNHNDQTFRLLHILEKKYPTFDGLNLSWETLEGIVKHNGPIRNGLPSNSALRSIHAFSARYDLELETYASAEAQVAALSDDIAYNSHDIDDGFKAGLFTLDQLRQVPILGQMMSDIDKAYPHLTPEAVIQETIRRLLNTFVGFMYTETKKRLADAKPQSAQDVRNLSFPVVALDDLAKKSLGEVHQFLMDNMYCHPAILEMKSIGRAIVRDLYTTERHKRFREQGEEGSIGTADFVANLTDVEALTLHEKLTGKKYVSPFVKNLRAVNT
jgi:dGTPase